MCTINVNTHENNTALRHVFPTILLNQNLEQYDHDADVISVAVQLVRCNKV